MVFLGPEPQCLDHVDFAFNFKATKHQSSKIWFFFFQVSLAILGFLNFNMILGISFSVSPN